MVRPNLSEERKKKLLPIVARAFVELGYRRATTAELAARCKVQENTLFRLWPGKKTMFLASIDYVFGLSREIWTRVIADAGDEASAAELLFQYEIEHYGEFGTHRIVFAGLNEVDDPDIREALSRMYRDFHDFLERLLKARRRKGKPRASGPDEDLLAWGLIGLGTVTNIVKELRLEKTAKRKELFKQIGQCLLDAE